MRLVRSFSYFLATASDTAYYRIYNRYKMKVASMAILTDANPKWRPSEFSAELFNCQLSLKFPVVKLSDYRDKREALEKEKNPFAIVVLAHLAAQESGADLNAILTSKRNLIRRLYQNNYDKAKIVNLFTFIDFALTLPEDLELQLWQDIQEYEGSLDMRYITSVERIGIKKGLEQGLERGLEQGLEQGLERGLEQGREEGVKQGLEQGLKFALELKFGKEGRKFFPIIAQLESAEELNRFQSKLKSAKTPAELKKWYA